jgi:N-acetylglucosaminyldiphosphoundecaprenol N-acetyl-beta-D-mannosaminyltransferase
VLGMLVDELDASAALAQVQDWAANATSRYVCFANVHMVMEAYDEPTFRAMVNAADLVAADGAPVKWASQMMGLTRQSRVCGPNFSLQLCEMASRCEIPVGFYGSTPEVLEALRRNVARRFPSLHIVFCEAPPFRSLTPAEDEDVVCRINAAGVRILFVALGCPKQEKWIADHRGRIFSTMLGVGYAFELLAGKATRAPNWMQTFGMEWAYRLLQDPRKVWRRYLKHNPRFVILILLQVLRQRSTRLVLRRRIQ